MPSPIPQTRDVVIERQHTPWSGRSAVTLVRFSHRRFNGGMSEVREWEVLRRGAAAAVLPYDPWTDQVVLIEQFRVAALAAGLDPILTEIPAGMTDNGETAEQTILREIGEEANLQADHLVPINDVLLSAGISDERIAIFAGRVHAPATGPDGIAGHAGLEGEGEDIRIRVVPASKAIAHAIAGRYPEAVTTIALLWLAARHQALRAEWLA